MTSLFDVLAEMIYVKILEYKDINAGIVIKMLLKLLYFPFPDLLRATITDIKRHHRMFPLLGAVDSTWPISAYRSLSSGSRCD